VLAHEAQEEKSKEPTQTYQVTAKAFDEEMPMISVIVKNRQVPNALIDGGSGVNIITDTLRRKLGLKKIEPAPFTIKMADQRKVMPKGIIRDVRLDVGGIVIRTTLTVIDMVSTEDSYSLLLGRPWLKEAQAQHDWPLNKLTLTQGGNKVEISTQRTPALSPARRPLNWEDYDWEMGLTDEEEAVVYEAFPELLPLGDFDLKSLKKLRGLSCNTVGVDTPKEPGKLGAQKGENEKPRSRKATKKEQEAMEEKPIYPSQFYKAKEGDIVVDRTPASEAVKGKKIAGWTVGDEELVKNLNLGTPEDPKLVKIAKDLGKYEEKVKELLLKFKDVFAFTYKDMKGIPPHICEHKIELQPEAKPVRQMRYRMNPNYAAKVKEEIDKYLEARFIYPVDKTEWLSPIVIVPKKNGKLRVCVDYRKLNAVTKVDPFPLPFTESILEAVAGHEMYTLMDGYSGYNQIMIALEDQLKTSFITEYGAFAYRVMPFGLMCAPATFQRGMMKIFADYLDKFMKVFLDDFTVYGTKENHIEHLEKCLIKCRENGVSLNPEKCYFCVNSGRLLGHVVCQKGLLVDPKKVGVIKELLPPTTVRGIRSFLGQATYHRKFIWMYAEITRPLYLLLKKGEKYVWTKSCQKAFEEVKKRLTTTPILITPNWSMDFHVHCDASNIAIGAVLAQNIHGDRDSPIHYASRLLNSAEKNYSTTEREALAMIYSVGKFRHYLLANHFIFYVDHQALIYLVNRPVISGRIARWMLLLQEYDFEVVYKPGRSHVMADHLSIIGSGEEPSGVQDQFPDAGLFMVHVQPFEDWRAPFIEYLTHGKLLSPLATPQEQTRIRQLSEPFFLEDGKLQRVNISGKIHECIADDTPM
jgi:hypothetical protein